MKRALFFPTCGDVEQMEAQHEYYAAHKLVITSALDAGVTDTMEKQPADPVLHPAPFKIVTHGFMYRSRKSITSASKGVNA